MDFRLSVGELHVSQLIPLANDEHQPATRGSRVRKQVSIRGEVYLAGRARSSKLLTYIDFY
jgi:hypothetical protein